MITRLTPNLVRKSVHYLESHGLVYLANAVSASSSIKLALRQLAGEENPQRPHDRSSSPFVKDVLRTESYEFARLSSAVPFSVVRNP